MASISNYQESVQVYKHVANCILTTSSGYTSYSEKLQGSNIKSIEKLVRNLPIPIIREGKINTLDDLYDVKKAEVYSAAVGSVITSSQRITKNFLDIIK